VWAWQEVCVFSVLAICLPGEREFSNVLCGFIIAIEMKNKYFNYRANTQRWREGEREREREGEV